MRENRLFVYLCFLTALLMLSASCNAQRLLNKNISIAVQNKPVAEVLKLIGEKGEFGFSYNSDIIAGDSLVSLSIKSVSVKQVLNELLPGKYLYKETGDYVIIQSAPREKYFQVTGQVFDIETKKEADYVSVYSKTHFVSALTDDSGFFKLRLKDRDFPLLLYVSKIGYADTSIVIHSESDAVVKIGIYPKAIDLDTLVITNSNRNNFWLVRLLVSSRLRAQSRNLGNFFISLPFQASLAPGLSTHGRLSTQIVNKFSVNIYGGYTAGVNGVEIGGLFNISRKDARYLQVATAFNAVSGNFIGVQIGGLYNQVLDSIKGVQLSAGVNVVKRRVYGAQISGVGNVAGNDMQGLQLAGFFNYAKIMKGLQVGLINVADSSSGYSVGFINIVKKGSGAVSAFASEIVPWNLAWKSGNRTLYNIFTVGSSLNHLNEAYVFGFGFGRESGLSKNLKLNNELTAQTIYLGSWTNRPMLYRLHTGLSIKLSRRLSLNAGPAVSLFTFTHDEFKAHYQSFANRGFLRFSTGSATHGWLGWQGGLSWNYNHR